MLFKYLKGMGTTDMSLYLPHNLDSNEKSRKPSANKGQRNVTKSSLLLLYWSIEHDISLNIMAIYCFITPSSMIFNFMTPYGNILRKPLLTKFV